MGEYNGTSVVSQPNTRALNNSEIIFMGFANMSIVIKHIENCFNKNYLWSQYFYLNMNWNVYIDKMQASMEYKNTLCIL